MYNLADLRKTAKAQPHRSTPADLSLDSRIKGMISLGQKPVRAPMVARSIPVPEQVRYVPDVVPKTYIRK